MADIQRLGLGILKLITNGAERDLGLEPGTIYEKGEPFLQKFVEQVIPDKEIEVHPAIGTLYDIADRIYQGRRLKPDVTTKLLT